MKWYFRYILIYFFISFILLVATYSTQIEPEHTGSWAILLLIAYIIIENRNNILNWLKREWNLSTNPPNSKKLEKEFSSIINSQKSKK